MTLKNLAFAALFAAAATVQAQEKKTHLPLREAISMGVENADQVQLAQARLSTSGYDLQGVKNNRYPDLKVTGQYLRLANADINLRHQNVDAEQPENGSSSPKTNQLLLGQANVNMPLFSGFKLKNAIDASENLYRSEAASMQFSKEETAIQIIRLYADLYKVQRSVELYRESLKSSMRRVSDFEAMVTNGLLARNDLLKAQLQVSQIRLSLDESEKNERIINNYLVTLLKLPTNTSLEVGPEDIENDLLSYSVKAQNEALSQRKDLEALALAEKAGEANVKVAKAGYYPSLALVGGYTALDLENVVTVKNAMNVGVGISYNLSSLFKNGAEVKAAKSRVKELEKQEEILSTKIKNEIIEARENYELALKQDQVYREAVAQADENFRIVTDKYENGLSDTSDLLEADVEQLSANINLEFAKANIVLKFYQLLSATGQLTESFNLTK